MGRKPADTPSGDTSYRFPISTEAHETLSRLERDQAIGERKRYCQLLIEWFAAQEESIQQAVVGTLASDVEPDRSKVRFPAMENRTRPQGEGEGDFERGRQSVRRASRKRPRQDNQGDGA